jgi:bifunctional DNA-binding transcriptional regulator/antitoxin component of YhaV-PrlF toxin-antitoxin module
VPLAGRKAGSRYSLSSAQAHLERNSIKKELEVARKKLVEHNALVQAIEMGLSKEEVMEKFGYKSLSALKVAYLNALAALDKIPALNKKRKKKKVDNNIKINSRGSLVIPKNLVDSLRLNESDRFKVEKDGTGLSLKIVEKPIKTILKKKKNQFGNNPIPVGLNTD